MYRTIYDRFGMNDIPKVCLGNLWKANKKPTDTDKANLCPGNMFTTFEEDAKLKNNYDLKHEDDSEWWAKALLEDTKAEGPSDTDGEENDILSAILGFIVDHRGPEDGWADGEDEDEDDEYDWDEVDGWDDLDYDPDYYGEIDWEDDDSN